MQNAHSGIKALLDFFVKKTDRDFKADHDDR